MKNVTLFDALFFAAIAVGFAIGAYAAFLPIWAMTKYVMGW